MAYVIALRPGDASSCHQGRTALGHLVKGHVVWAAMAPVRLSVPALVARGYDPIGTRVRHSVVARARRPPLARDYGSFQLTLLDATCRIRLSSDLIGVGSIEYSPPPVIPANLPVPPASSKVSCPFLPL